MRTPLPAILALFIASRIAWGQIPAGPPIPDDAAILKILSDRVDKHQQSLGIVIGVIAPEGRRVVAYGSLGRGDPRTLNGDTVFEIGSITKVFTSLLLASMVENGEVALDHPVGKYLPAGVLSPDREGRQIQLLDLATHTSGLPRMPSNVQSRDSRNPFAEYSVDDLYAFLTTHQPDARPGARFEYSNLGGALLGHVLARRAGEDYEDLIRTRITEPLGMRSTLITPTPEMKTRLATGHVYMLEPTPNWGLGALAAAGGLHSTANDLLSFLAANLGYSKTPLASAMSAMLDVRRNAGPGEVALAWFADKQDGVEIINHSGGTGGYMSFIGYDRRTRLGVVVLSNTGVGSRITDIGMHLLNPRVPLLDEKELKPPKRRSEIPVDPNVLETYAGRYRFPSGRFATITSEDGHLCLQGEGDVKIAFYPESKTEFFAKFMDAQIIFKTENGVVTELDYVQNGNSSRESVRRIR